MPYCTNCGAENPAGARFCNGCGAAMGAATGSPRPEAVQGELVTPRIKASVPDFVRKALHPGEQLLAAFNASLFDHHRQTKLPRHDKFVLTTDRIICYHTKLIHSGMGEMPYRTITEVSYTRGFIHGKVVVNAANAGITFDGISNDDAAFAEKIIAGRVAGRSFRTATG